MKLSSSNQPRIYSQVKTKPKISFQGLETALAASLGTQIALSLPPPASAQYLKKEGKLKELENKLIKYDPEYKSCWKCCKDKSPMQRLGMGFYVKANEEIDAKIKQAEKALATYKEPQNKINAFA